MNVDPLSALVTLRAGPDTPEAHRRLDGQQKRTGADVAKVEVGTWGMLFGLPGIMREGLVWELTQPWPDQWLDPETPRLVVTDPGELDWPCMVCGAWRPDAAISDARRPAPDYITARIPGQIFNVRHCNDRPECVAYAHAEGPWAGSPLRQDNGG